MVRDSRRYQHFILVNSRAFRDSPHSRSRCRNSKECLVDVLKMVILALSQIYTPVFHLWRSVDLDGVWVGDFGVYQLSFLS